MDVSKLSPRKEFFLLFLLLIPLYFLFLGNHPLLLPDEGRYTEVAREMLASGDFITPHLNGSVFFHKPVLFYWLQAFSLSHFGINPWSIRLFPALFGIFGVLFLYGATCTLWGQSTARKAAIILATTPVYFGAAHYANLDLEVAIWLNVSILSLLVGLRQNKKTWLILAYVAGALAFLTKGLIGFVFPAAILGLWILLTNQWRLLKKAHLFLGLVLFALITLPWLYLVSERNPDFLHFFFYVQQFQRFSSGGFNNVMPFWFYVAVVIVGFLPWSIFFLGNLKPLIKNALKDREELYLLIWALVVLVFFSLPSSKLVGYILPIFAPMALLTARLLEENQETSKSLYNIVAVFLSLIAIITLSQAIYPMKGMLKPAGMDLLFGGIISTIGALTLFYGNRFFKNFSQKAFYVLSLTMTLLCLVVAHSISHANTKALNSTRDLAKALPNNIAPLSLVSYHTYFQDLPLYSNQTVRVVYGWDRVKGDNWASELSYGLTHGPSQKDRLITDEVFWQLWDGKTPLYVVLRRKDLVDFALKAGAFNVIAQNDYAILVTQGQ